MPHGIRAAQYSLLELVDHVLSHLRDGNLAFAVAAGRRVRVAGVRPDSRKRDGRHQRSKPGVRSDRRDYIAKRKIPPENVTRLKTAVADELDRAAYEYFIEVPISQTLTRHGTQDRIHYIVLTKGIPLRVRGTGGLEGSTASVDSELTLLYRKLLGIPIPPAGRVPNPYYLGTRLPSEAQRFAHRTHDIYLVTRLDGFTVDDVIKLIDRGAAPRNEGVFVLDQRAVLIGNRVGDDWLSSAADRLATDGLAARVQLERSKSPAAAANPALGYYSWGSNDVSVSSRRVGVTFAPGALAGMFVSTDARTFKEPPAEWNIGKWGRAERLLRRIAAVADRRSHPRRRHRRVGSCRRAVSRWKRQTADFVPGVCRGLQSRRVVLSFDPVSILAEHRHRRSVVCAVQKNERRRRRS